MRFTIYPRGASLESINVQLEDADIETLKQHGSIEYRPGGAPTLKLIYVRAADLPCDACNEKTRLKTCTCIEDCGKWEECGARERV